MPEGDTRLLLSYNHYVNVYPYALPSYYWVRVKNIYTGCYRDAEVVVQ